MEEILCFCWSIEKDNRSIFYVSRWWHPNL